MVVGACRTHSATGQCARTIPQHLSEHRPTRHQRASRTSSSGSVYRSAGVLDSIYRPDSNRMAHGIAPDRCASVELLAGQCISNLRRCCGHCPSAKFGTGTVARCISSRAQSSSESAAKSERRVCDSAGGRCRCQCRDLRLTRAIEIGTASPANQKRCVHSSGGAVVAGRFGHTRRAAGCDFRATVFCAAKTR